MMDTRITDYTARTRSVEEYAADLARNGVRVLPGGPGTFWVGFDAGTMIRRPTFHLTPPGPGEVQQVLWRGRATVASYLLEPDEHHPANAWLYLCTDQSYALEKLSGTMRQELRRGLKELTITPITLDQVLAYGGQAFCDTRRRLGLSDGTPERFRRHFTGLAGLPAYVYLGAWKDEQLAAFLTIIEVDDWVEIEGSYSMDALRLSRPNQILFYSAFSHYLVEQKCRLVCGGLSSIQAEQTGLHIFKTKVGYKARPVHRAFVFHPLLRPFVNHLALWSLRTALRIWPGNLSLKRAGGMLAYMLGDTHLLEAVARSKDAK